MQYESTKEIIVNGNCKTLCDILDYIGITEEHKANQGFEGILLSACVAKLKMIQMEEKKIHDHPLVISIKYLVNHQNNENLEKLRYLLETARGDAG